MLSFLLCDFSFLQWLLSELVSTLVQLNLGFPCPPCPHPGGRGHLVVQCGCREGPQGIALSGLWVLFEWEVTSCRAAMQGEMTTWWRWGWITGFAADGPSQATVSSPGLTVQNHGLSPMTWRAAAQHGWQEETLSPTPPCPPGPPQGPSPQPRQTARWPRPLGSWEEGRPEQDPQHTCTRSVTAASKGKGPTSHIWRNPCADPVFSWAPGLTWHMPAPSCCSSSRTVLKSPWRCKAP